MLIENCIVTVPQTYKGKRLDQAMAELYPNYSRSRLQTWIKAGFIKINNRFSSQREILHGGEEIHINIEIEEGQTTDQKEPIPIDFIHIDNDIIILNKPAGLVVHPGAGNPKHTLLNALLYHVPDLKQLPRAGIIQRLDKDTSGIMVVARSLKAHLDLINQLHKRSATRIYQAILQGVMTAGGKIDAPIGRHPIKRKRMAVIDAGKQAVTHYKVLKKFTAHSHVELRLESGRTHQIRVHMAHIKHPVVGDPVYGGKLKFSKHAHSKLIQELEVFPRQALHASYLEITHPSSKAKMSWRAPLPVDMKKLLNVLDKHEQKI